MIQRVYSIYDKAAGTYQFLMLSVNDAVMARDIRNGSPESAVFRINASEFQLRCVGEFDPTSGEIGRGNIQVVAEMATLFNQE